MYKNILVPLDGSKRAEAILPHVEEIAGRFNTIVTLLQVVVSHQVMVTHYEVTEMLEQALVQSSDEAKAYLNALRGDLRVKGIEAKVCVERGPVVETITNVAARVNADLIAMASHGRGGLSRVFYGSVAAGVLQRVDRPLLLVRSRDREE